MRKGTALLLMLAIVVLVMGGLAVSNAACTMAGSCKAADGNITCGNTGKITEQNNISLHANQGTNQSELEACSDSGAPNQQGRLNLRINHNTSQPGARLSLDSDRDQTPSNICCGYVNAQVGAQGTGLYCSEDGFAGDGYSQTWSAPGQDGSPGINEPGDRPGGVECLPGEDNLP